jgi:hypothetical protein
VVSSEVRPAGEEAKVTGAPSIVAVTLRDGSCRCGRTGSSAVVEKLSVSGSVPLSPVALAASNCAVSLPIAWPARSGPAPWDASFRQRRRSS